MLKESLKQIATNYSKRNLEQIKFANQQPAKQAWYKSSLQKVFPKILWLMVFWKDHECIEVSSMKAKEDWNFAG